MQLFRRRSSTCRFLHKAACCAPGPDSSIGPHVGERTAGTARLLIALTVLGFWLFGTRTALAQQRVMNETSVHVQSEWIKTDQSGNGAGRSPAGASSSSVSARRIAASDRRLTAPPETNRVEDVPADSLPDVSSGATSIADVDGDGNQDLLITGSDKNGINIARVYLGNGDATFSVAGAGLEGVYMGTTSIADVDGDGKQDLLITGHDEEDNSTTTLYLGNGEGGFSKADADLTNVSGGSTSIADLNGDGNPDLLVTGDASSDDAALSKTVPSTTLYLGNGEGGFSVADAGLTDVSGGSTSIADVDGDGNKDLLIAGDPHEGHIRIGGGEPEPITTLYLGDGAGNFSEANADLLNIGNGSTSFADFNGDGNPDLLIAGKDPSDTPAAALYLGDGNGGFSKAEVDLTSVHDPAASTADVNGDENEDLLIVGATRPMSNPVIKLYQGHGDGTFSAGSLDLTGVYNATASIADVNRDADQDLFVTGSNSSHEPNTALYLGNGDGTFTPVEDR